MNTPQILKMMFLWIWIKTKKINLTDPKTTQSKKTFKLINLQKDLKTKENLDLLKNLIKMFKT